MKADRKMNVTVSIPFSLLDWMETHPKASANRSAFITELIEEEMERRRATIRPPAPPESWSPPADEGDEQ